MDDETVIEICADHCGAACCSGDIFVGDVDASHLEEAGYEDFRTPSSLMVTDEDDSCRFLGDDNRCTIYEDRPLDCRLFPLGFRIVEEDIEIVLADCPLSEHMGADLIQDLVDQAIELIGQYSKSDLLAYDRIPFSTETSVVETIPLSTVHSSIK